MYIPSDESVPSAVRVYLFPSMWVCRCRVPQRLLFTADIVTKSIKRAYLDQMNPKAKLSSIQTSIQNVGHMQSVSKGSCCTDKGKNAIR